MFYYIKCVKVLSEIKNNILSSMPLLSKLKIAARLVKINIKNI